MERIIKSACQGSHSECGVLVHVSDGVVTKIEGDPEHPWSQGYICVKGRAQHEWLYHPDRLKYPLKRAGEKAGGKWQRISWDQALNEIAQKFTEIKDKYGPLSLATYHGTGPRTAGGATRRLAAAMGTPNVISTDLHICYAPSIVAETFTVGTSIMMEKGPDYPFSKCILVIGGNPLVSHPPRGVGIVQAMQRNNAKLIVVDPRRTPLAARADTWLQIRPGTDVAFALGMINVIINEGLYDKEFVNKWCYGFDKLKERAKQYSPEKVAEITWIPSARIREVATLYATTKPAVIHHRVAVEHNLNSTQTSRALAILIALTGNIDIKGGNLLPTTQGRHPPSTLPLEIEEKRIGSKEFPLISSNEAPLVFVHPALAAEAMLTDKPYLLKGIYCAGANPVICMQNSRKMWQAFKNLELFVVADFFMTPTAELADYVLPAATWLERDECCTEYLNRYIGVRRKAIEPLFECWDDRDIVSGLVARMPWADRKALPENNADEWNESTAKSLGTTFTELKQKGYILTPVKYKKYEETGFNTPTRKVELYSTVFEKHGYDPLPNFVEPPQSPVSTPELMKDYPFILIAGARYIEYYHSGGRQIPSLRKRVPEPEIEIHPDTARKASIVNGDWVWVETPQIKGERVKLKVKITDGIDPRVVHTASAWWFPEKPPPEHGCFDSNINVIISDGPPREPISGAVAVRGTLCKVYK